VTERSEPSERPFLLEHPDDPGRSVRGSVSVPPSAGNRLPHVVILHGFKGFMDWGFFPELARRFARRGIAAVRFNFSGSGIGADPFAFTEAEAFARNTYSRELEDVARVRAAIRTGEIPHLDPQRTALFGHSRGGGIALVHAAEDGAYRGVVTWAAVDDFDRFDDATKSLWREAGHLLVRNARTGQDHRIDLDLLEDLERNRDRLDILAACRRLRAPVLLVHGEQDEAVPVQALARLAAALAEHAHVLSIAGAGHTFGAGHPFGAPTAEWERAASASIAHVEACLRP
jgi:dienelactone hydrolase